MSKSWKMSNRIALFIVPLIFGLREILFSGNRWESRELGVPKVVQSVWDAKESFSPPLATIVSQQLPPHSHQLQQTDNDHNHVHEKAALRKTPLDLILQSIQRDVVAEMEEMEQANMQNGIKPRPFPRFNNNNNDTNITLPFVPADPDWLGYDTTQRSPAHEGLFYVKTHKTASTTVMGVAIRLAKKMAERHNEQLHNTTTSYEACNSRFEHWPAYLLDYRHRQRDKSFLFAVLREPTRRAISMFFHFEVSRGKNEPMDSTFQKFLTRLPGPDPTTFREYYPWGAAYDHYLHYLNVDGYSIGQNDTDLRIQTVNKILEDYDFIGVTERLDESLVALQMILGLKTSDILYYSAKGNSNFDDKGVYIQPSFVSKGMEQFFASSEWRGLSKGDYMLYMAANASLDRTIESLGRSEFYQQLTLFQQAKQLVATHCPNIRPLYSFKGKAEQTDCLLADAGCGSQCFDRLEREFRI